MTRRSTWRATTGSSSRARTAPASSLRRASGPLPRVAAIGRATAEALGGADLVPRVSTQEGLLAELPRPAGKVLFAAAEGARRLLVDQLDADFVALYRTRELVPDATPHGDLVVLASPSAARAFACARHGHPARCRSGRRRRASPARPASTCWSEADTQDLDGLVAAVEAVGRALTRLMVVCFLTDFGLQDDFVGTCHGVIARIAPDVRVIDVTHGIPPQAVLQGALVLAGTLPYMPIGVHLAVVDPGVGGVRRPVALRDNEGRLFVGPDNGLLLPAAERAGIAEVHELANPAYALPSISRTFHGRDLFAPAAAHLAERRSARGARAAAGAGRARAARAPRARRSRTTACWRRCSTSTASATSR